MKKITLLTIIILVSVFYFNNVYSIQNPVHYSCYNPNSSLPMCQPLNLTLSQINLLCCDNNPQCISKYVAPYSPEQCTLGCCYNPSTSECTPNIIKKNCPYQFDSQLNGLCYNDSVTLFAGCNKECCCAKTGSFMVIPSQCSSIGGTIIKDTISPEHCRSLCNLLKCKQGCLMRRPYFCNQGVIKEDCTGGDGIVGNGNDCGCPYNLKCLPSGKCVISNNTKHITINKTITCSTHSHPDNGICVCDEGYYDNLCTIGNIHVDLNRDGCFSNNPCLTHSSSKWFYIIYFILLVIVIYLLFQKYTGFKIDFRNKKDNNQNETNNISSQSYQNNYLGNNQPNNNQEYNENPAYNQNNYYYKK